MSRKSPGAVPGPPDPRDKQCEAEAGRAAAAEPELEMRVVEAETGAPELVDTGPGVSEATALDASSGSSDGVPPGAVDAVPEEVDSVAEIVAERDEYLDALRRLQAEFENYKKRMLKLQTQHLEQAAEALVIKLLPVLDTIDLARAHGGDDGLDQVATALYDVLAKEGLERIEPLGQPFDPNEAEAVLLEPATGPTRSGLDISPGPASDIRREPADEPLGSEGDASGEWSDRGEPQVIEVLRAGYRWKGRVLRAAMVKVKG